MYQIEICKQNDFLELEKTDMTQSLAAIVSIEYNKKGYQIVIIGSKSSMHDLLLLVTATQYKN